MPDNVVDNFIERMPVLNRLDSHFREVVRRASGVFLLQVVGAGLGFLLNILLARLFGAQGAGYYYLALTVMMIATVFGRMGLDNTVMRFLAINVQQRAWDKVAVIYRYAMGLAAGVSLLVSAIVFATASWIAEGLFAEPELTSIIRMMSLGITPSALLLLHAQAFKALQQAALAILVSAVAVSGLNIALLVALSRFFGTDSIAIAYVTTQVSLLLGSIIIWQYLVPKAQVQKANFDVKLLISTSLPLFWVASMHLVMKWIDTFMLGIWTDAAEVGIYGVAARTAFLTSFVLSAVNSVVAPKFATLYEEGNLLALGKLARNAALLMTLLSLPVLIVFVFFSSQILSIFGEGFAGGGIALAILACGQFVNVATGSVGHLLVMSGREKIFRNNIVFGAILNALLNFLLIPRFGLVGAAAATATATMMMNLRAVWLAKKHLGISTMGLAKIFA